MKKSQHTRKYETMLATLRRAREKSGLTQLEVSALLGTYATYVSKCESGERRIDVVELAEFCKVYRIPVSAFLKSAGLM